MTSSTHPRLKVLLAVLFWGGSYTATKIAVSRVSPVAVLWLRFGIGAAVLGLVLFLKKRLQLLPLHQMTELCFLGFFGVFLHNYIQAWGLRTAAAGISALIIACTPVIIALLSAFLLKEKLVQRQSLGIIMAAFGVLFILSKGNLAFLKEGNYSFGELLVVCSAFTWALFSVFSRKALKTIPPALAMFYVILSGWFFSSIPFLFQGVREISKLDMAGWGSTLFLGVFCSALAYVFWYDALKLLPASEVGVFLYISPIVAVAVAWIFLGEPLLLSSIIGGGLVLTGARIVNYRKKS